MVTYPTKLVAPFLFTSKFKHYLILENKLKSADSNRRKKVVVFGDSITQHGFNPANNGWVNSLNNWWTRV